MGKCNVLMPISSAILGTCLRRFAQNVAMTNPHRSITHTASVLMGQSGTGHIASHAVLKAEEKIGRARSILRYLMQASNNARFVKTLRSLLNFMQTVVLQMVQRSIVHGVKRACLILQNKHSIKPTQAKQLNVQHHQKTLFPQFLITRQNANSIWGLTLTSFICCNFTSSKKANAPYLELA